MARIAYDDRDAAAFLANRHLTDDGLAAWRAAVARHLRPLPGRRLLDLGAGTGSWARAFTAWFPGLEVVAVEPSAAMRARSVHRPVVAGDATHLPLTAGCTDAAWMSTMVHHVPDLGAAARELRRVVRPGGPLLIRSVFAGRYEGLTLVRYFPEAAAVLDTYPSVADVEAAFATAGFRTVALEPVAQTTAGSVREAAAALRRDAHTPLKLIGDEAYAAGVRRLRTAADTVPGPVVDTMDLLVLR
ncbi:methyltransferase domain-containing protein [Dactylosporangium aurantiacum]|uniref:Methyltransferase domain-containing protein n=1 Tax=Dactylosporangium aurantiacum TaxID=35754 RepID=A0A9Q9IBV6_9ACTN|nr:methyltransferase domain-containing protein [Dactylosporangium aurantiacum]MDG6104977.1 methyltransferase domain-containing protein [Dactylosporangium aurantiacum]UWZ51513.1 methyltransferase domain-containing protein [Dactylosporangium aurantiacum]